MSRSPRGGFIWEAIVVLTVGGGIAGAAAFFGPEIVPLEGPRPAGSLVISLEGTAPAPGEVAMHLATWEEDFARLAGEWRPGQPIWVRRIGASEEPAAIARRLRHELAFERVQVQEEVR